MSKNIQFESQIYKIRHSAAHILAQAVLRIHKNVLHTIGPVIDNGFYFDFYSPEYTFGPEDLPKIEAEMHEIVEANYLIEGNQTPLSKAREIFCKNKFKCELIDGIESSGGVTAGVYTQGEFVELCRGGHTEKTGDVKFFKLTNVSGAYWRGDSTREQLQRIYGLAFQTKEELDAHVKMVEEAKLYDHKLLGKKLDLFSFSPLAPGSVFFHPKGTIVYNQLVEYNRKVKASFGYQELRTPLVLKDTLWKTSGHYENYRENMFFVEKPATEAEGFAIRPMNCPCAMLVYGTKLRSYKELPLKLAEYGMCHRNELSGTLNGLFRARVFTQDDTHIFCTEDQIQSVVSEALQIANIIYTKFNFTDVRFGLSTRPEKSIGTQEWWDAATKALEGALVSCGKEFDVLEGEGAFYGPKIEIIVRDALGREWTCGTVQVDPNLPERFGLEYVAADQSRKTPVAIHIAIYGSIERFFAILLEHSRGKLPFWLAPVQARILTIVDAAEPWANEVVEELKKLGIRAQADFSNDTIGSKVRDAQEEQIPVIIAIGRREAEARTVALRRADGKNDVITLEELKTKISTME